MLKKGDLVLAAAVLLLAGSILGYMGIKKNNAVNGTRIAVVKQNDRVIRRIDLDKVGQPETIILEGDYRNVVEVQKGRIRFLESSCPDLICVNMGWLDEVNEMAVCLPNKAIIKIEGTDAGGVDTKTF